MATLECEKIIAVRVLTIGYRNNDIIKFDISLKSPKLSMFVMNKRIPRRTFEEFQVTQFFKVSLNIQESPGPVEEVVRNEQGVVQISK